jgi:hypothetical protein
MQKALMAWREENGSLPERILFYRDGKLKINFVQLFLFIT